MSKKVTKRVMTPDRRYSSTKVAKFMNHIMKKGKKSIARNILYDAFDIIEKKTGEEPLDVFNKAMGNVMPQKEVRSMRVGGANYQVPYRVDTDRGETLAMRWILASARSGKGSPMKERLANEIISASKKEGSAMKKRHNVHRMAQANKAFAYLAR